MFPPVKLIRVAVMSSERVPERVSIGSEGLFALWIKAAFQDVAQSLIRILSPP